MAGRKEDIRHASYLEQVKSTSKGSFALSAGAFLLTKREAFKEGREPRWAITFLGAKPNGSDLTLIVTEENG